MTRTGLVPFVSLCSFAVTDFLFSILNTSVEPVLVSKSYQLKAAVY